MKSQEQAPAIDPLTLFNFYNQTLPQKEMVIGKQLLEQTKPCNIPQLVDLDPADIEAQLKIHINCEPAVNIFFLHTGGGQVEYGYQPLPTLLRTIDFFQREAFFLNEGKRMTPLQTAKLLYFHLHLTDIRGATSRKISFLMKARREQVNPDYLNPAEIFNIKSPKLAAIINFQFDHLIRHHTGLVALPLGLVEACFHLLQTNKAVREQYLNFVKKIAAQQEKTETLFIGYISDYLCHRLFELGEFAVAKKALPFPRQNSSQRILYECRETTSRLKGGRNITFPWQSLLLYPEGIWEERLLTAFNYLQEKGELFFDVNKVWTHGGVVREFANRYPPSTETVILEDAKKNGITIKRAVVLGLGQAGFEAVEVMQRLKLKEIYGVDIVPFPEKYRLMPRALQRDENGNLLSGYLYQEKPQSDNLPSRLKWANFSPTPPSFLAGTYSMRKKTAAPIHRATQFLPYIDIMEPDKFEAFQEKRKKIKPLRADLLTDLKPCQKILKRCDVVYLRNVLCLYKIKEALTLIRNAMRFGNPRGFYLVIQNQSSLENYPFSQGVIYRIESDNGRQKIKLTPLSWQFRPFHFTDEEIFFRSRWLKPDSSLTDNLLKLWLKNQPF